MFSWQVPGPDSPHAPPAEDCILGRDRGTDSNRAARSAAEVPRRQPARGGRARTVYRDDREETIVMASSQPASAGRSKVFVQQVAMAVGAVFLVVGVAGFIPGITTNVDDLEFAGHSSGAELLGLFQVSI